MLTVYHRVPLSIPHQYAPTTQSVRAACRSLKLGCPLPYGMIRMADSAAKMKARKAKKASAAAPTYAAKARGFFRRLFGAK
jgi:hypothetical protein